MSEQAFTKSVPVPGAGVFPASVFLTEKIGLVFQGILKSRKEIDVKGRGIRVVYDMETIFTDAPTKRKDMNGQFIDVDIEKGEIVSLVAPARLARTLDTLDTETAVQIKYLGTSKTSKGGDAHDFEVKI